MKKMGLFLCICCSKDYLKQLLKCTWNLGLVRIATVKLPEKIAYHCQDDILVGDCLSPFVDDKVPFYRVPFYIHVKYCVNKHVEESA